ncbi:MAG: lipoprotein signal peptidase [Bacteroidia bacterium]|nr:lipoprotein signal peptidase [Bacteroidia bacterium]NNM22984.1 lipoprotein signal peptidase [Flavobacteriaceae bacterium]
MSLKKAVFLIILILLIDQISKIYIKTNFVLGEEVDVLSWFKIHFVENKGMAWGVQIPGAYGKLILTIFRLFAIVGIGYWLWDSVRKHAPRVLLISIALIFAGAFGNIIDSVFYGLIFEDSYGQVSGIFPEGGGYGKLFHGKVVDMFSFSFFNPVFNVADSSISVGVALLLVFNKKAFPKKEKEKEIDPTNAPETQS